MPPFPESNLRSCACSLSLLTFLFILGCGATTARIDVAPTVDTNGLPGFESTFSLGIGMPLDFHGRSHHYVQALGSLGGGRDTDTSSGLFVGALAFNYIYWAEPHMDVRGGVRLAYRSTPGAPDTPQLYSLGAQVALLPIVLGSDAGWLPVHFCLGPELRLEQLWSDPSGSDRGLFSVPLIAEINFLAAGD